MLDPSLTCWTSPPYGDVSPYVLHPHLLVGFPVHLYVWWISACYMVNIPLCWVLGAFPHMLGVWGGIYTSVNLVCLAVHPLGVHYALPCIFL